METIKETEEQNYTLPSAAEYEAMAQATLKLTPAEVAARVRPYVANMVIPALPDLTFSVGEAGIYLSHGYWRIPIHPSYDAKRLSLVAEAYTDLTEKLEECEGFLIVLEIGDPRTDE